MSTSSRINSIRIVVDTYRERFKAQENVLSWVNSYLTDRGKEYMIPRCIEGGSLKIWKVSIFNELFIEDAIKQTFLQHTRCIDFNHNQFQVFHRALNLLLTNRLGQQLITDATRFCKHTPLVFISSTTWYYQEDHTIFCDILKNCTEEYPQQILGKDTEWGSLPMHRGCYDFLIDSETKEVQSTFAITTKSYAAALFHEITHFVHKHEKNNRFQHITDQFSCYHQRWHQRFFHNREEYATIRKENAFRKEVGLWERVGHVSPNPAVPPSVNIQVHAAIKKVFCDAIPQLQYRIEQLLMTYEETKDKKSFRDSLEVLWEYYITSNSLSKREIVKEFVCYTLHERYLFQVAFNKWIALPREDRIPLKTSIEEVEREITLSTGGSDDLSRNVRFILDI